jgi:hypothetical protein
MKIPATGLWGCWRSSFAPAYLEGIHSGASLWHSKLAPTVSGASGGSLVNFFEQGGGIGEFVGSELAKHFGAFPRA